MLYPMYVHLGDENHSHGVTMPDFPGCFTAADDWEDLPSMIHEAVELHFEGEDSPISEPSSLDQLAKDPQYQDGVWLMVDIDLSKLSGKAKRVNITMSEQLLANIDHYVTKQGGNRSAMLAKAAINYMSEHPVKG